MLEMQAMGLVDTWQDVYQPVKLRKWLNRNNGLMIGKDQKKKNSSDEQPPASLTLKQFMSVFIILVAGYITSYFAFLAERMAYCFNN